MIDPLDKLTKTGGRFLIEDDGSRLLAFLDEPRIMFGIMFGIKGDREQVIRKLTALLFCISQMEVPQGEFVKRLQKRELEENTPITAIEARTPRFKTELDSRQNCEISCFSE